MDKIEDDETNKIGRESCGKKDHKEIEWFNISRV